MLKVNFFCVEGSILAIKPGTTVIDLTFFRTKPSLAKPHQSVALGQEVVIVVLQVVSYIQICLLMFLIFVFQAQLPKTNCVSVCVYLYIRKYTIYMRIQNLEFHDTKKKILPFL